MGCCSGTSLAASNEQVEKEIGEAKLHAQLVKKLLLLGAGGSGKSTLFKQLQNIHGGGHEEVDRKTYRSRVLEQIIESMKIMIIKAKEYVEKEFPNANECQKYKLKEENAERANYVLSLKLNQEVNQEFTSNMKELWNDDAIQQMFAIRNKICVPDSTSYFFGALDRITAPNYVPDETDLLLVRHRTTGMTEKTYTIQETQFKICDVGGQRNERRKWIHYFENVAAVLFVAALSSYDEVTFEDDNLNAMQESLQIFEEHVNMNWFESTAFILFLNKDDIFQQKIQKTPITVCFADYKGSQEYNASLSYIRDCFEEKNQKPHDRGLYCHVTCATNPGNIKSVFADVQHIVVDWSLQRAGLV